MKNLALIYSNQGRLEEAGELQERVLISKIGVLGRDHHSTLTSMKILATYKTQGRLGNAEQLQKQISEVERQAGKDHPDSIISVAIAPHTVSSPPQLHQLIETGDKVECAISQALAQNGKISFIILKALNRVSPSIVDQRIFHAVKAFSKDIQRLATEKLHEEISIVLENRARSIAIRVRKFVAIPKFGDLPELLGQLTPKHPLNGSFEPNANADELNPPNAPSELDNSYESDTANTINEPRESSKPIELIEDAKTIEQVSHYLASKALLDIFLEEVEKSLQPPASQQVTMQNILPVICREY